MPTPAQLLEVCLRAAAAGAEELIAWRGRFGTREKNPRDLVTDADLASQQAVQRVVRQHFPDHAFMAEESRQSPEIRRRMLDPQENRHCWVIDPLDGTTNYVHGFPCYAVSAAVVQDGELAAGVVLDPLHSECFAAARGAGAWLNEEPIQVSQVEQVAQSLVAVSFPPHLTVESADLQSFLRVAPLCQAVRRTGSAALNLAYVASGRLDAHWAHQIHPWDAAAGVLLVREAGGVVGSSTGGRFDLAEAAYLASSTRALFDELAELMGETRRGG